MTGTRAMPSLLPPAMLLLASLTSARAASQDRSKAGVLVNRYYATMTMAGFATDEARHEALCHDWAGLFSVNATYNAGAAPPKGVGQLHGREAIYNMCTGWGYGKGTMAGPSGKYDFNPLTRALSSNFAATWAMQNGSPVEGGHVFFFDSNFTSIVDVVIYDRTSHTPPPPYAQMGASRLIDALNHKSCMEFGKLFMENGTLVGDTFVQGRADITNWCETKIASDHWPAHEAIAKVFYNSILNPHGGTDTPGALRLMIGQDRFYHSQEISTTYPIDLFFHDETAVLRAAVFYLR